MRLNGDISDAAYDQIEEELDRRELALTPVVRRTRQAEHRFVNRALRLYS